MRKFLSISFAALLLVSTIGLIVHKHYCADELVAISFLPHSEKDACDTEMPMENGACSDEHENFNVTNPLVLLVSNFEITLLYDFIGLSFFEYDLIQISYNYIPKLYADANPPPSEPNIYIKVQSFLL